MAPTKCADATVLSRCLRQRRNHIDMSDPAHPVPKAAAFEARPGQTSGQLELSTFAVADLNADGAWTLLQEHAGANQPSTIAGKADFEAGETSNAEPALTYHADWTPERHVNILSWASSPEDRLMQSLHLITNSTVQLNPARKS